MVARKNLDHLFIEGWQTTQVSAPASSSAFLGSINSDCSTPWGRKDGDLHSFKLVGHVASPGEFS